MIRGSIEKISDRLYAIGNPGLPAFLLLGEIPALFEAGMTFMGPAYLARKRAYFDRTQENHNIREGRFWDD